MPVIPLTTQPRIAARMGQLGVDLRADDADVSPGSSDMTPDQLINAAIADASTEARGYVARLYSEAQLAGSAWLELKVRDIAVYYLCLRRLNPAPNAAQTMYEKAIADLELVRDGATQLPDAPMDKQNSPVLTNQRLSLWPFPNIVNVPSRSTGTPEGYTPHNDPTDIDPL